MKKKLLSLLFLALLVASIFVVASCGGPVYTVTLDPAGGTLVGEETIKVGEGEKIPEPEDPTREGFIFNGWYTGKSKDSKWDFENGVVTGDVTLKAWWSGGIAACEHQYVPITDPEIVSEPTCKTDGMSGEKCLLCGMTNYTPLPALDHNKVEVVIDPTCGSDGYTYKYCDREGCSWVGNTTNVNTNRPPHDWSSYETVMESSYYIAGSEKKTCGECSAVQTFRIPALCEMDDERLWDLDIGNYTYTGGEYTNASFVNTSGYAGSFATSYYTICDSKRLIDGSLTTYWCADTLTDGSKYTGDEIYIDFAEARDIGVINLIVPKYSAWDLGENCYVSYDVYARVDGNYQKIAEISDKMATVTGIYGSIFYELDAPVYADGLKLVVSHSTRYTPAMIYEIEVLAKTEDTQRISASLKESATVILSGKYNEYATGGEALMDGSFTSGWQTDYRRKAEDHPIFATLDFTDDKFVSAIQFAVPASGNRQYSLYYWENNDWVKQGIYEIKQGATVTFTEGGEIINAGRELCVFTIELEKTTSKVKLIIDNDSTWDSFVYCFEAYTVLEQAFGLSPYTGCSHFSMKETKKAAPTCTTAGYTEYKCEKCGKITKTDSTNLPATGHTWGAYTVTTAATATKAGTKTSTCTVPGCGQKRSTLYTDSYEAPTITTYLNNAPAAWSMTLDDGNYISTYEWVIPYLQEYGFKATTVLTVGMMDGYVSNWQKYFATGAIDLGSHSYTHSSIYGGKMNEVSALSEIEDAHYWFMSKFPGQRLLTYAAPNGTTSPFAAEYLTNIMAANRNGGQGLTFYNLIEDLTTKKAWGNLNSYISKLDQTEGAFIFSDIDTSMTYKYVTDDPEIDASTGEQKVDEKGNPVYKAPYYTYVKGSYTSEKESSFVDGNSGDYIMVKNPNGFYKFVDKKTVGQNYVYDKTTNRMINQPDLEGTYYYDASNWRYEWREVGSYDKNGDTYTFRNDNKGKYRLLHPDLGSFEKGITTLLDTGSWTVECMHGILESDKKTVDYITISYTSFISKCEYLKKAGIWCGSYTEVTQYIRESQSATIETTSISDTEIKLMLTDELDDIMYNFPLTIKVDIPDAWEFGIIATQAGKEIDFFIEDGYAYVNAVPDRGEIVVRAANLCSDGTLNHSFSGWSIVDEATCTTDGSRSRVCSTCQHEQEEIIPASHKPGKWQYSQTGKTSTCSECGDETTVAFTDCTNDHFVPIGVTVKGDVSTDSLVNKLADKDTAKSAITATGNEATIEITPFVKTKDINCIAITGGGNATYKIEVRTSETTYVEIGSGTLDGSTSYVEVDIDECDVYSVRITITGTGAALNEVVFYKEK